MARASQPNPLNPAGNGSLIDYGKNHTSYPILRPSHIEVYGSALDYAAALISPKGILAIELDNQNEYRSTRREFRRGVIAGNYNKHIEPHRIALALQACRFEYMHSELGGKIAPVVDAIKKDGLINFLEKYKEDPFLEIAKRALIPSFGKSEGKFSLKERINNLIKDVKSDTWKETTRLLLTKALLSTTDGLVGIESCAGVLPKTDPIFSIERQVKLLVASEIGLLNKRQIAIFLAEKDIERQKKVLSSLADELSDARAVLQQAVTKKIVDLPTAEAELEKLLEPKNLEQFRGHLRALEGEIKFRQGLKLKDSEIDWDRLDKSVAAGEITKAKRISSS